MDEVRVRGNPWMSRPWAWGMKRVAMADLLCE